MLNKAPIFINGFQRGGTTILFDLISSHPQVCSLDGETHELFFSKDRHPFRKWLKRLLYFPLWSPVWISAREHTFLTINLRNRNAIPKPVMYYVDLLFYWRKLISSTNQYKYEDVKYSDSERQNSRLLCKNVNGVVLATDVLFKMYPDATFIALVRNGLAICESFIHRGYTAKYCGILYERICQKMIHDSQNMKKYHIVRFEDMVSEPVSFIKTLYDYADLELNLVSKFRLNCRQSMGRDGKRKYTKDVKQNKWLWLPVSEFDTFFRQDVNENQIQYLSKKDREIFLNYARESMEYFGYI